MFILDINNSMFKIIELVLRKYVLSVFYSSHLQQNKQKKNPAGLI